MLITDRSECKSENLAGSIHKHSTTKSDPIKNVREFRGLNNKFGVAMIVSKEESRNRFQDGLTVLLTPHLLSCNCHEVGII